MTRLAPITTPNHMSTWLNSSLLLSACGVGAICTTDWFKNAIDKRKIEVDEVVEVVVGLAVGIAANYYNFIFNNYFIINST